MTPKNRKLIYVFGSLLIAVLIFTACVPQELEVQTVIETVVVKEPGEETVKIETVVVTIEPEVVTPEPGPKALRVNLGTYPDIIDPQKSSFVNEIAHLKLIYEGLTKLNGKLETVPGAAESWEYNEDATELTFTLREGLKYGDGSVLNALRFRYALLRNIDPETAGEYASITDEVLGAPEWRMGEGDVAYFNMYGVAYALTILWDESTPEYYRFAVTTRENEKPIFYAVVGKNSEITNWSAYFSIAQQLFRESEAPLKKSW